MTTSTRIQVSLVAAAAVLLTLAGCPGKKNADLELAAAEAAIDAARGKRAANCAKEIFSAAEVVVREAKELSEKGDYDAARAKAAEAESLANQARAASPPGCDKDDDDAAAAAAGLDRKDADTDNVGRNLALEDAIETIYFDYNQAFIREDSKAVLSKVADILRRDPKLKLEVEGHCDSRGSTEYNLHLGERRAQSVMKYLLTQGAGSDQLETISYGEERPVDLGEAESAHQRNRRAELKRR